MLKIRILTASMLGAGLLVSLFLMPPSGTVLVFALVLTLAAWEWAAFGRVRSRAARLAYVAGVAALLWLSWQWTMSPAHLELFLMAACAWWVMAFLWLTLAPERHQPAVALLCGIPVLVPAFVALARVQVSVRGFARGPELVLWMLLLVFAADIGAYFAGRSLGRHKLAPRVSPGKTWEGAIGGLLAVGLVALAGTAGVSLAWLAQGEGPAPELVSLDPRARSPEASGPDRTQFHLLPKVAAVAAAGSAQHLADGATEFIGFRHDWLSATFNREPEDIILETAVGDSMEPYIRDGDLLLDRHVAHEVVNCSLRALVSSARATSVASAIIGKT